MTYKANCQTCASTIARESAFFEDAGRGPDRSIREQSLLTAAGQPRNRTTGTGTTVRALAEAFPLRATLGGTDHDRAHHGTGRPCGAIPAVSGYGYDSGLNEAAPPACGAAASSATHYRCPGTYSHDRVQRSGCQGRSPSHATRTYD